MNRNHKKNPMGTVGMDYLKRPAIIEMPNPMPMQLPQIPQSPHPQQQSVQYSYPSSSKKIPKSKRFQKD